MRKKGQKGWVSGRQAELHATHRRRAGQVRRARKGRGAPPVYLETESGVPWWLARLLGGR